MVQILEQGESKTNASYKGTGNRAAAEGVQRKKLGKMGEKDLSVIGP